MTKDHCRECPYITKTRNARTITTFSAKHQKRHLCHMMVSGKDLWNSQLLDYKCFGSRKYFDSLEEKK